MARAAYIMFVFLAVVAGSCARNESNQNAEPVTVAIPSAPEPAATPAPAMPNLQAEILDERNKTTEHGIGKFDFRNYTYELPRGWQNPDGTTAFTLTSGKVAPIAKDLREEMSDEQKAEARAQRRIGMSYVTTKYIDVTGDGADDAIVILKVETGGAAIPQLVYVFTWKNESPELIWPFRTGDRADGGLKDIRSENGEMVVELYGQDRFLLGQTETGKITGDEEQLCCPTFFTRTHYRWNGNSFLLNKKRLTFSVADPHAPPVENLGDKVNKPQTGKK
jgi:hypothetical protein